MVYCALPLTRRHTTAAVNKTTPPLPKAERRSGRDRRQEDLGPPSADRRRGIEPRKPEVNEVDISDSEWNRLQEAVRPAPPAPDK